MRSTQYTASKSPAAHGHLGLKAARRAAASLVFAVAVTSASACSSAEVEHGAGQEDSSASSASQVSKSPAKISDSGERTSKIDGETPAAVGSNVNLPDNTEVEYNDSYGTFSAAFINLRTGEYEGTGSARIARPGLSLTKLYIAEYVLQHGSDEDKYTALRMLADSSDAAAQELYEKFPMSVDEVARQYELYSTRGGQRWGDSMTSAYDVAYFVGSLLRENPTHPVLMAMMLASDVAEDGYAQNYGTTVLEGAEGTKWGWSDDRTINSSVSFGEGWIASAMVEGSADDLTEVVEAQLGELAHEAVESAGGVAAASAGDSEDEAEDPQKGSGSSLKESESKSAETASKGRSASTPTPKGASD